MASIFVTHGGGPYPILQKEKHAKMYDQLKSLRQAYPQPKAVIIFSAHWEESAWTILDHDTPNLLYDYYGFPKESYNLSYSMRSTTAIRSQIKDHLLSKGVKLQTNTKRGYDHGVFIPLMIMYPQGTIPVVQISLLKSLDPESHYKMGIALRELKNQGFLIIGSGSSVHGGFFQPESEKLSQIFDNQLSSIIENEYNEKEILSRITNWRKLQYSAYFHPREEHLVPLFINLGTYEGKKKEVLKLHIYNLHMSNYLLE